MKLKLVVLRRDNQSVDQGEAHQCAPNQHSHPDTSFSQVVSPVDGFCNGSFVKWTDKPLECKNHWQKGKQQQEKTCVAGDAVAAQVGDIPGDDVRYSVFDCMHYHRD